jgi:hypothetical protein
MKIPDSVKNGSMRSLQSWKGALMVWFITLILVELLAVPLKGVMKAGFDSSMIVDRMKYGFDIEAFTDPGTAFKNIISFLKGGFLIIIPVSFLINAFLTGGLFSGVSDQKNNSGRAFFWISSAKNFWSFLVILSFISLITIVLALIVVILPVSIISSKEGQSELVIFRTGMIVSAVFLLLISILILVADFARAWQVKHEGNRCFSAIAFGFRQTFTTIAVSWPLMIFLLLIQVAYYFLVARFLPAITPSTGMGVFLFFILSQVLFFIQILLKIFRYGSITYLMETDELRRTDTELHGGPQRFTENGI